MVILLKLRLCIKKSSSKTKFRTEFIFEMEINGKGKPLFPKGDWLLNFSMKSLLFLRKKPKNVNKSKDNVGGKYPMSL